MSVHNPNTNHYSSEDVIRLKQLITEGCTVMQEVEDLKEGLSETVKAIAEEVGVKPSHLNRAIKTAHKNNFDEQRDDFDIVEDILDTVGRK